MNKEYRVSTGYKITYFALAAVLIGFGFFSFTINRAGVLGNFLSVLLIACGLVIIIVQQQRRVIVTDSLLTITSLFKTRELYLNDIKGIRYNGKVIIIESLSQPKVNLRSYDDFAGSKELVNWLQDEFTDLDTVEHDAELDRILNDSNLGFTEQERKYELRKAKYISSVYSVIGFACLINVFIDIAHITEFLLVYPLVSVAIIATSKGLIKLISEKKTPYYNIIIGIMMPVIVLVVKTIADYHLFKMDKFWLPFGSVALVVAVALLLVEKKTETTPKSRLLAVLLVACSYAFGSIRAVNCEFDNSQASIYHTEVTEHRISKGKSTSYYITVKPWGPQKYPHEITVQKSIYNNAYPGSMVEIDFKKGLLNIPWYEVFAGNL